MIVSLETKDLKMPPRDVFAQLRLTDCEMNRHRKRYLNFSYEQLKDFHKALKRFQVEKHLPLNANVTRLPYTKNKSVLRASSTTVFGRERASNLRPTSSTQFENFSKTFL